MAQQPEEKSAEIPAEVKSDATNQAPEAFDWDAFEHGSETVDEADREEIETLYEKNLNVLSRLQVVEGEVIELTDREVIVDINSKSEGVISLNEFRYNPDLKVGDKVDVMVDRLEDKAGQLVLSHRKSRSVKAWQRVNKAYDDGEVINGYIKSRTKGGMIVDVFGIEAFLPGSQIDVKPIRDYDSYVGKIMEFKVVKINREFKNVVVSHKALIQADLEIQKKAIIKKLETGQVLEGIAKNITSYGVFVDLGGIDGLVHITDLSWVRVSHPSELVELDQKLKVVILDFDESRTKIQLGIKQLGPHPWDTLDPELKVGDKIKGKVVVVADYGAFVEFSPGVEGLVHVSEMSWSTHLRSAQDFVTVGDRVEAVILTLNREERKMSLGFKQLKPDPWAAIADQYAVGTRHTGIIRNFTNFGVFVELQEGIDGLIHITDLSWNKKIKHPNEFVQVGESIETVVLELDIENRKLNLGHKQLMKNPWDALEKKYAPGTRHKAVIKNAFDKGAIVNFEEDGEKVEAFIPGRHLEKQGGGKLGRGDEAEFLVIEFSKEFKRIVLSHTAVFRAEEARNIAQNAQDNTIEKSTLGDLDALAELKKKMKKGD